MFLDRGGSCEGMIYKLFDADEAGQLSQLLQGEIGSHEALESVRWVTVRTGTEKFQALTFYVCPSEFSSYVGQLPLTEVAHNIAQACGYIGSCAQYLSQTVSKLKAQLVGNSSGG